MNPLQKALLEVAKQLTIIANMDVDATGTATAATADQPAVIENEKKAKPAKSSGVTHDSIRDMIRVYRTDNIENSELVNENKRKIKNIGKEFGVKKIEQLTADQVEDFAAAIEKTFCPF